MDAEIEGYDTCKLTFYHMTVKLPEGEVNFPIQEYDNTMEKNYEVLLNRCSTPNNNVSIERLMSKEFSDDVMRKVMEHFNVEEEMVYVVEFIPKFSFSEIRPLLLKEKENKEG